VSTGARVALVLILLGGLVVAYLSTTWNDLADRSLCDSMYSQARTFADSAAVDQRTAPRERGRRAGTVGTPTCGELRKVSATRGR
jgi:hypothetical protein